VSAANQSATSNMSVPQGKGSNTSAEPTLAALAILYTNNQLADLDLWDRIFTLISLLGIDKFQSYNAQNIMCSLIQIGTFTQQCPLGNKLTKDLSNLAEVSVVAWYLINAIYESG